MVLQSNDWLDEILDGLMDFSPARGQRQRRDGTVRHLTGAEVREEAIEAIEARLQQTEKAYGGCKKCYGKGYATVIEYASGYDTDQDIGSLGGKVHFRKSPIKYCTCDRGKQLERHIHQELVVELEALKKSAAWIITDDHMTNYERAMLRKLDDRIKTLKGKG